MPQPRLLIDGYNLLHAAGLARERYGVGGLERARNRLLATLAKLLTREERARTVVVFDARGADQSYLSTQRHAGMRIEFPSRLKEADDRIEELIAENTAPKGLVVVSGDRRLHTAVQRRRGSFETGPQFLRRLYSRDDDAPAAEDEKPDGNAASAREIEFWRRRIHDLFRKP